MDKNKLGYGGIAGAGIPEEMRQVGVQFDHLEKEIAILRENIITLDSRLISVLKPEPPCGQEGEISNQPALVDLAGKIRDYVSDINRLNKRLVSMLNRLQL